MASAGRLWEMDEATYTGSKAVQLFGNTPTMSTRVQVIMQRIREKLDVRSSFADPEAQVIVVGPTRQLRPPHALQLI